MTDSKIACSRTQEVTSPFVNHGYLVAVIRTYGFSIPFSLSGINLIDPYDSNSSLGPPSCQRSGLVHIKMLLR